MVMTQEEVDACPRVYCRRGTGYWWRAMPLTWHERANTGMDFPGCYVSAVIEGEMLRVQHGSDPAQSRLFTLDELNRVGRCHDDPNPVHAWFELIHAHMAGRSRGGEGPASGDRPEAGGEPRVEREEDDAGSGRTGR